MSMPVLGEPTMSTWDWLFNWGSGRADAAPQLPAPTGSTELVERRDGTYNPFTGLGGLADKGQVARPNPYVIPLSNDELGSSYDNSGICRRIIDLLPDEATRRGWTVPDIPVEEERRLRLYDRVCEGAKMGRLFGGAIGLLVTDEDIPPAFRRRPESWFEQPLDLRRVGALRAVQIFDPYEARPFAYERDVREVGYRRPRLWSIAADGISGRFHASRVVYFMGANRPPSQLRWGWLRSNTMPDNSVIQAVWDEIRRLSETMAGGAVLAQELSQNVLQIQSLAAKTTGDQADPFQQILRRIQQSLSVLGMVVLGPGDSFQKLSTPATGFKDLSEGAQAMLATAMGWPRSMLSGEPPGGLSTDDAAGAERERKIISLYQEQRLRTPLEQIYTVMYASQDGPTGGQAPDDWGLQFAPLNEPSDQEKADLQKTVAETDHLRITDGVYGPEVVAEQRYGADGFVLELVDVPIPDPEEEAALAAAQAAMLAEANPPAPEADPANADAIDDDAVCLLVPAADPGLRAAVERAIGQSLTVEASPHVTLLYVGGELPEEAIAEVVGVATEEAARATPGTLARGTVRALPAGSDGVPIVVEFEDTWAVAGLHDVLLARLAHLVSARQHPRYRPHVTLGYARAPLSAEALGALASVDAGEARVPVSAVVVTVGKAVRATLPVGS